MTTEYETRRCGHTPEGGQPCRWMGPAAVRETNGKMTWLCPLCATRHGED